MFSQLYLILASSFKIKMPTAFNVINGRVWPFECDGTAVGNSLVCLAESKRVNKETLEAAIEALGKIVLPSMNLIKLSKEKLAQPATLVLVKVYKLGINNIYAWLKNVEASFSPDSLDELDAEKLTDAATLRKLEEMRLFFTVKQKMMFNLSIVLAELKQEVPLPRMSYDLPDGFVADLEKGYEVIQKLFVLLERSDKVKEEGKIAKTASKIALEEERVRAEKEQAKLKKERALAEKQAELEKKKAEDNEKSLLKSREGLVLAQAAAAAKKEAERKKGEALAKAKEERPQEKAEKEVKSAPQAISPRQASHGVTMYPVLLTAKLIIDDSRKVIHEVGVVRNEQPSVFATQPKRILELLHRVTEGWTLDDSLVANLITFNDGLHQIDIRDLEEQTRKIISTFAACDDREAAVTAFFKRYSIDQVAVMKGVIARVKESVFSEKATFVK